RRLQLHRLSYQRDGRVLLACTLGKPGACLEPKDSDVAGKQRLSSFLSCSFERIEALNRSSRFVVAAELGGTKAASKMRDSFGPGESIPVQSRRLARNEVG